MESFATSDGRALTYRREGSGPVVVCHPGGPGFSSLYFGDLAGLGERFTLVLLDPRGTGSSSRPFDPLAYGVDDYVQDVDELRQHLGVERLLLLGHSHGGVVAQAYAAAYPMRVERLVLASTLARFQEEQVDAMADAMEERKEEPWFEDAVAALEEEQAGAWASDEELGAITFREFPLYFARYGEREAAYLSTIQDDVPNGDALRLFNREIFTAFDLRPALSRVSAPTLVITGEEDFITGPVCAREIAAELPDAQLVLLPNCGHFIFVEARERFAAEVGAFLSGGAPAR
jgi:pimeloyl-ACP methyl ester carboxylesterase